MKRKIMKIADTTFVVSLPLKWAREHGVKKGDEVEVEEKGSQLNISLHKREEALRKRIVDVKNHHELSGRYISSLYRTGYDEFEVQFSESSMAPVLVHKMSENTIGLAVIKQKDTSLTIKDLSGLKPEELPNIMRRMWLLLLELAEDLQTILQGSNFDKLQRYWEREKIINQFMNYSLRLFNASKGHSHAEYYFVRRLEGISDCYKDLALFLYELKPKHIEGLVQIIKEVNQTLRSLYELYYTFSDDKCEVIVSDCKKIQNSVKTMLSNNTAYLIYIAQIISIIKELCSPLIEMQL